MDLEAIWQQHKAFILKVAGGALVFLILSGISSSIGGKAQVLSRSAASQQATVLDRLAELEGNEGLEKGREDALGSTIEPVLMRTVLWTVDPDYVVPDGEKEPSRYFVRRWRKILGTRGELARAAEQWDAKIPSKEQLLSSSVGDEPAEVAEKLAQLDLVRRVIKAMLGANVREIRSVELGDPGYAKRKGDGKFLRELPIELRFTADVKVMSEVLKAFQVKGSFLEVTDWSVARQDDEKAGGQVDVSLTLRALGIVATPPGDAVPTDGSGTSGNGSDPAPTFRRER